MYAYIYIVCVFILALIHIPFFGKEKKISFRNRTIPFLVQNWIDIPLEKLREILEEIKIELDNKHIDFCLMDGTALGAYRQGRLIDRDDDVDICIHKHNFDNFVENVLPLLRKKGYKICRYINEKNDVFVGLVRNNIKVDIFFRDKSGMFEEFEDVKLYDVDYKMPSPAENYLEYRYGENWYIRKRM